MWSHLLLWKLQQNGVLGREVTLSPANMSERQRRDEVGTIWNVAHKVQSMFCWLLLQGLIVYLKTYSGLCKSA